MDHDVTKSDSAGNSDSAAKCVIAERSGSAGVKIKTKASVSEIRRSVGFFQDTGGF